MVLNPLINSLKIKFLTISYVIFFFQYTLHLDIKLVKNIFLNINQKSKYFPIYFAHDFQFYFYTPCVF